MSGYLPKEVEEKWYSFWEEGGYFRADAGSRKASFCLSIPPPNVTGVLHMGHALVDTLQDVLIRWKRMSGFEALWIPGTDHAGIATQTVVERHLMGTEGKRRVDYERDEFLARVWRWKEESQGQILGQLRMLGCSCDWSRLAFTMDEKRSRAVRTLFKKMFDAGLIYRGDYLVNWDPVTQTALADDEVEYEERESSLWFFRYPLEEGKGSVTIATTRPETMLGDTAVAVSPEDDRYRDLIGKKVVLPLSQRAIPIIADRRVDPTFGTGAVKVTPAHDPNDYEMGLDHHLPMINMMTPDGRVLEGMYAGLRMDEARHAVVAEMKKLGFLEQVLPHKHRVGVSYRSKAVIEPYLSKQWFVRMSQFKRPLREAVEKGKVKLIPENWESTYFHWIDNLRDWCISRQLWWGHRIPIWYNRDNPEKMLCAVDETPDPDQWVQDEDVLDTWFSSALWPFSILGWPEKTADLSKFYPNSSLITGHDILFFWVARMILMGEYVMGEVPFPETFLHGLVYGKSYWRVRAEGGITYVKAEERLKYDLGEPLPTDVHMKWEKMSKSKGNIIDPLEIIETYGTDAMRLGLCASATQARQIDLDRRKFEEFKNFVNKIWNGARFVFLNIESLASEQLSRGLGRLALEDRWILSRLNQAIQAVNKHLTDYAFDKGAMAAYEFFWNEFCAYYVELSKPILFGKVGTPEQKETKQKILTVVLCNAIRLLHPMAPFITEELFQKLKRQFSGTSSDLYAGETLQALSSPACIVAPYPHVLAPCEPEIEATFAFINEVVYAIRNIRAEMQIPPSTFTDLILVASQKDRSLIEANSSLLQTLARLEQITFTEQHPALPFSATAIVGPLTLIIPLPPELREKERIRLTKEQEKLTKSANSLKTQLSNPDFLAKAPPPLIDKLKAQLAQAEASLTETATKLNAFT